MKALLLYLSGPMAGLPDDNRPAFAAEAARLRAAGHTVYNPAEKDQAGPFRGWNDDAEWKARNATIHLLRLSEPQRRIWLRDDVLALSICDGIVILPGWQDSSGARAEISWAIAVGMDLYYACPRGTLPSGTDPLCHPRKSGREPARDITAPTPPDGAASAPANHPQGPPTRRAGSILMPALATLGILYVAAFAAYVCALAICPDHVAGPHSWEWTGLRECADPDGHDDAFRGPAWDIAGGAR